MPWPGVARCSSLIRWTFEAVVGKNQSLQDTGQRESRVATVYLPTNLRVVGFLWWWVGLVSVKVLEQEFLVLEACPSWGVVGMLSNNLFANHCCSCLL